MISGADHMCFNPFRFYAYSPSSQTLIVVMAGSPLHYDVGESIMRRSGAALGALSIRFADLADYPKRCAGRSFLSEPQKIRSKRKRREGGDGRGGGRKKTWAREPDGSTDGSDVDAEDTEVPRCSMDMIPDDGIAINYQPVFVVEVAVAQMMEQVMAKAQRWFDHHTSSMVGVLVVFIPEVRKPELPKRSDPLPYEWDGKDKELAAVRGSAPGPFEIEGEAYTGEFGTVCLKLVRVAGDMDDQVQSEGGPESRADGGFLWKRSEDRSLYVETVLITPWSGDGVSQTVLPERFAQEIRSMGVAVGRAVTTWYASSAGPAAGLQASQRLEASPLLDFDWPRVRDDMSWGMRSNALDRWRGRVADREEARLKAVDHPERSLLRRE